MTKVAADYEISDVALEKICVKHRNPVPGRGYWARKAAGHKVKQAVFRSVSDPATHSAHTHTKRWLQKTADGDGRKVRENPGF